MKTIKPAVHPMGSCTKYGNDHCGHPLQKNALTCCRCGEVYRDSR